MALANNRDLRVSVLNIEQARAAFQIQRADALPGGQRRRHRQPRLDARRRAADQRLPGRPVGHGVRARPVRPRAQPERRRAGAVPGHRGSAQDGADQPDRHGGQRLPDACWPTRSCWTLTQQTLKTREESLRLTQLRFDNGVVVQARPAAGRVAGRTGARAVLAQQQRQRAQDVNALTLLVGQPIPDNLPAGADPGRRPTCPTCRPACRPTCWSRVRTSAPPSSS